MSLLSIVQGVALRCNFPQPSVAFASTDPVIQLMVACAQDAGDDASERVDWAALKQQALTIFTGNGATPAFPVPIGFQRLSPSDVFISSLYPTLRMPGPVNEDDLIAMKRLPITAQPSVWRQVIFNGVMSIEFFPVLSAGEVVSYVYAAGTWITGTLGNPYSPSIWQADTDLSLIPERIIRLGAVWRWKRRKGLDYAEEMTDYEGALDRLGAQEKTGRIINMSTTISVTDADTWFPGTITDFTDQNY